MKQNVKLPNIEQKEPLLNEMRHLIKNSEDIKGLIQGLWHDESAPAVKAMDRVGEEVRKQRRVMGRLVQTLSSETGSIKHDQIPSAGQSELIRTAIDETPTRNSQHTERSSHKHEDEHHMRKILEEQQKMLKIQTDLLAETRKLIESVVLTAPAHHTRQLQEVPTTKDSQPIKSQDDQGSVNSFEFRLQQMQAHLQKDPNDIRCVQELVGSLFRQATIEAFSDYSRGMPEQDMKTKFAEVILNRYRQYMLAIQSLKGYDVATIERLENLFEKLGRKSIEFLLFKYPQSKKKISDAALARHIKQTKRMTHPQFDILRNGGIELNLQNLNQGLNKQLKMLINTLIRETSRYYETYKKFMVDIFLEQERLDPSFSYLIGRKIRETTQEYTDEELNMPGFFIKSNEILRILIKWIEELISWFTDPKRTLDNQFGFKYEGLDEKLGVDDREDMWSRFQESYNDLQKDFEEAELFIRRTLSSIIGISRSEIVGKYTLEPMAFISRHDILVPLICKYVSDTLQCYAVLLINACLSRTAEVQETYSNEHSEISSFSLYSFTVNDLLRCKCTGKKNQIIAVYSKLRQLEEQDKLSIIMVKNRLGGPTQDILITYKIRDCFLLCEIQLALSTTNEQINDHFNHFLYEQHRSRHGIICELAMMFNTLDPRQKYFRSNKLSFRSEEKVFQLSGDNIVCSKDPTRQLELYKNDIPYMCGQCCRFIDAFRYYMASKECKGCFRKLCPPCYMRMLPRDVAIRLMLEPLPMLKGYFKDCSDPLIEHQPKKLEEEIYKKLSEKDAQTDKSQKKDSKKTKKDSKGEQQTDPEYLLLVVYKNNLYNWSLRLIKIYTEVYQEEEGEEEYDKDGNEIERKMIQKTRKHILQAFTNKTVDLTDYDSSMILFMRPKGKVESLTDEQVRSMIAKAKSQKTEEPFDWMYELQDDYDPDNEYDVFTVKNSGKDTRSKDKRILLDYSLSNAEIDEMMSEHRFRALVKAENSAKNGRLVLKDLALNFQILKDLKLPETITYLEIVDCFEPESVDKVEYTCLNEFKNMEFLYIKDLETYDTHYPFAFNSHLQELGVCSYVLSSFTNIPFSSKCLKVLSLSDNQIAEALPKMDLPVLTTLQLNNNKISDIKALTESNLPLLDKLELSGNCIAESLPELKTPRLRVLVLNNNKLENVDNLLKTKFEFLKMLELKNNEIKGAVPDLGHFPKLLRAELQNNNFSSLPKLESKSLEVLYLERNHLAGELPALKLSQLTHLDLYENQLTSVEALKDCDFSSLQELTLYANSFEKFPLLSFPELTKLDIEPEKMRFKVDPNRQNDNNDIDSLECGVCEETIQTYGADYDLGEHNFVCKKCLEAAQPKPKTIVVCMVLGEDLLRYA